MSYGIKSPARYMQGNGELANLGKNVKKMGEKFLVLCSPNNKKRVGAQIEESLKSVEKEVVFCEFNGECTKAAERDARPLVCTRHAAILP